MNWKWWRIPQRTWAEGKGDTVNVSDGQIGLVQGPLDGAWLGIGEVRYEGNGGPQRAGDLPNCAGGHGWPQRGVCRHALRRWQKG